MWLNAQNTQYTAKYDSKYYLLKVSTQFQHTHIYTYTT